MLPGASSTSDTSSSLRSISFRPEHTCSANGHTSSAYQGLIPSVQGIQRCSACLRPHGTLSPETQIWRQQVSLAHDEQRRLRHRFRCYSRIQNWYTLIVSNNSHPKDQALAAILKAIVYISSALSLALALFIADVYRLQPSINIHNEAFSIPVLLLAFQRGRGCPNFRS